MRLLVIALLLLSGCAYNAKLLPRGGGDVATGTVNKASRSMEVQLKGETYKGSLANGSLGLALGAGAKPVLAGVNQFSTLMLSGQKTLRCDFALQGTGGNGVCVDGSNTTYDLMLE